MNSLIMGCLKLITKAKKKNCMSPYNYCTKLNCLDIENLFSGNVRRQGIIPFSHQRLVKGKAKLAA